MIILGIDSSSLVASVAIVADDQLIAEYTVNYKKTHSQTLLPMFDQVARMVELDLHTIDGIAVAGGPGSFTGLRIGTATAKGLGLALEKPLIHVPTLDALAYTMWGSNMLLCPMMDARRNQVYTGLYHCHSGLEVVKPQWAGDVEELVEELSDADISQKARDIAAAFGQAQTKKKRHKLDEVDLEQMSLFDVVKDDDILEELKNIDLSNITPIEALNTLFGLQNKVKNRWQG